MWAVFVFYSSSHVLRARLALRRALLRDVRGYQLALGLEQVAIHKLGLVCLQLFVCGREWRSVSHSCLHCFVACTLQQEYFYGPLPFFVLRLWCALQSITSAVHESLRHVYAHVVLVHVT